MPSSGERVKSPRPWPSHRLHLPATQSQPCPQPAATTAAPVQSEAALHLG